MSHSPLQVAYAFIQSGELEDALAALTQHLKTTPGDAPARRLRIQVYARLRTEAHLRAALDDLAQLPERTPEDTLWHSIVLEYLDDREAAANVIQQALQSPMDDAARERLAERLVYQLLALRRLDDARALIATMPRTWDWLQKAGDVASESDNPAEAITFYTEALSLLASAFDLSNDSFAQAIQANLLVSRAQVHANLRQFAQADADYNAAQALIPDDPMLLFWWSFVVADLDEHERAISLCRRAFAAANDTWKTHMQEQLRLLSDTNPRFRELADAMLKD